ncbi:MAG TPA: hypothetical protein DD412_00170 [Holosporales bacterium]|nr:hypothetical protein [Holosporales bacterium]
MSKLNKENTPIKVLNATMDEMELVYNFGSEAVNNLGIKYTTSQIRLIQERANFIMKIKGLKKRLKALESGLLHGWKYSLMITTSITLLGWYFGDFIIAKLKLLPVLSNGVLGAVLLANLYALFINIYHWSWLVRMHAYVFGKEVGEEEEEYNIVEEERIERGIQGLIPSKNTPTRWASGFEVAQMINFVGDLRKLGLIIAKMPEIRKKRTKRGVMYLVDDEHNNTNSNSSLHTNTGVGTAPKE